MRACAQARLQVCLALACVMGAGFSGDLYAQHGPQSHHGNRYTRSAHARGNRSVSRSGLTDQLTDIDGLHHEERRISSVSSDSSHSGAAIVIRTAFLPPAFVELADVVPFAAPGLRDELRFVSPGRAPPIFL